MTRSSNRGQIQWTTNRGPVTITFAFWLTRLKRSKSSLESNLRGAGAVWPSSTVSGKSLGAM